MTDGIWVAYPQWFIQILAAQRSLFMMLLRADRARRFADSTLAQRGYAQHSKPWPHAHANPVAHHASNLPSAETTTIHSRKMEHSSLWQQRWINGIPWACTSPCLKVKTERINWTPNNHAHPGSINEARHLPVLAAWRAASHAARSVPTAR